MQYEKTSDEKSIFLQNRKNVDTGMGVERTLAILNKSDDIYQTSIFKPIIYEIERISKKKIWKKMEITKSMRVVAGITCEQQYSFWVMKKALNQVIWDKDMY